MSQLKLTDVAKINMGQSPSSETYNSEKNGLPFYQGNVDFGEKYPTVRIWCDKPTKIAEPGDILMSVRAPIGALNYANEKCCIGRGLAAITPDPDMTSSEFIYWFLRARHSELNRIGTGSTFKAINRKTLESIEFPKYNKNEQYYIAEILSKIDKTIGEKKAQLEKLDNLIKARFVEMFKDCIESVKLEQVVTSIKTGKLDANAEKKDGKYPFFTCDATPKRIDDYVFDTEAILISGNGSRVGHVHYYKGKFNAYQRTYVLSDFRHDVDLSYLKTYLENELRPYIARNKKGSAVPYITLPMLQNFKLPFPPLEKQKEFATFVAQVDKSKFTLSNELAMGNFYIRLIHDCIMHGCIDLRVPQ